MRNPDRIDVVLAELRKYWAAHSDLRLGQIIVNMSTRIDPFYMEDDELLIVLKGEVNRP